MSAYTSTDYSPVNNYYSYNYSNYNTQQDMTNYDSSISSYPSTPSSYASPPMSYYSPTELDSSIPKYQDYYNNFMPYQEESTSNELSLKVELTEAPVPMKKANNKRPRVVKLDLTKTSIGFGVPQKVSKLQGNQVSEIEGQLNCTMCSRSFKSSAKLFMHQHKYHKNGSSLQCPICLKKFNSQANALVHVRAHTQEKSYKCHICAVGFCDSSTLKKHVRTHTGEKPYECHLCPKRFTQSGNLKRHLTVHEKYDVIQAKHLDTNKVTNSEVKVENQYNTSQNCTQSIHYQAQEVHNINPHSIANNQSIYNYYPEQWQVDPNVNNSYVNYNNGQSYSNNNQYYYSNSF